MVRVAQQCKKTESHRTAYLWMIKMVNLMLHIYATICKRIPKYRPKKKKKSLGSLWKLHGRKDKEGGKDFQWV